MDPLKEVKTGEPEELLLPTLSPLLPELLKL
jgi:hypothetical protein